MTEKRFYFDENGINDREYEFSVLGEDELVDIINGIVDENEQLKNSGKFWYDEHKRIVNNYVDKIKEVEKENEQLKSDATVLIQANQDYRRENEQLKHDSTVLIMSNQDYRKENEQLKQAYHDAKSDVERYEQIIKDIMSNNLLIQDLENELRGDVE